MHFTAKRRNCAAEAASPKGLSHGLLDAKWQDFSHLVTRLKTNTERLNEVWLAQQASMAQTDDFKRRSQHVLSGSDDKVV